MYDILMEEAKKLGFDMIGLLNAAPEPDTRIKSIIVLIKSYRPFKDFPKHTGSVSSYYISSNSMHATSKEYANRLQQLGHFASAQTDSINMKKALYGARLGQYGRNSLIINKRYGSYIHLRAVATDIPASFSLPDSSVSGSINSDDPIMFAGCVKCHRCIDTCPAGAILDNGLIAQDKCLRNVMNGKLDPDKNTSFKLLSKMDNKIIGCDDCQKCCPANAKINSAQEEIPDEILKLLGLKTILKLENEEYLAHLSKIADLIGPNIARPRRIKINAAIAACNYHRNNEYNGNNLNNHNDGNNLNDRNDWYNWNNENDWYNENKLKLNFANELMQFLESSYSRDINPFYTDYIKETISKYS